MNRFLEKIKRIICPAADVDPAFGPQGRQDNVGPGTDSTTGNFGIGTVDLGESKIAESCPYCNSKEFVKRGMRKKKLEIVQLYLCRKCNRTFTAQFIKGKRYPTKLIIDAISIYNLGYGLEETCRLIKQRFGVNPGASTLNGWYGEYSELCRYSRLRKYGMELYKPEEIIETCTLAHRQLYRFRFHRAKMELVLKEFKNRNFGPLGEYLNNVSTETPHQYFQDGQRMSEVKTKFDKAQMIVRAKSNYANRLAHFVLQTVKDNKQRHEALQKFMLANDSVTVATEIPVFIRKEDIEHLQNQLNFEIPDYLIMKGGRPAAEIEGGVEPQGLPRLLTGHIDLLQVRNGQIHILDFKPNAAKEKPIEQLTWYALALSRLTGLRLYEFKCAWFDDKDYFEFFPLHVVKKIQNRKKKMVYLKSHGTSVAVPEENAIKIV